VRFSPLIAGAASAALLAGISVLAFADLPGLWVGLLSYVGRAMTNREQIEALLRRILTQQFAPAVSAATIET
jgi:hypothetical protein